MISVSPITDAMDPDRKRAIELGEKTGRMMTGESRAK